MIYEVVGHRIGLEVGFPDLDNFLSGETHIVVT